MSLETITIERACPKCGRVNKLLVSANAYSMWQAGAFIQDSFPELTVDQREIIQTGIDGECWSKMFGEAE